MNSPDRDTSQSLLNGLQHSQDRTVFNASWSRFNEKYVPRMYRWARARGLTSADAEEVTQDLMVCLVRRLKSLAYDPELSFQAWLKTVTSRAAMDYFRKRQRERPTEEMESLVDSSAVESEFNSIFDLEMLEEAKARVARQLEHTDAGARNYSIFLRLNDTQVTPDELATELGITRQAIYVARNRVLMMLKVEVAKIKKRGL